MRPITQPHREDRIVMDAIAQLLNIVFEDISHSHAFLGWTNPTGYLRKVFLLKSKKRNTAIKKLSYDYFVQKDSRFSLSPSRRYKRGKKKRPNKRWNCANPINIQSKAYASA
jgi:hypothetical protein